MITIYSLNSYPKIDPKIVKMTNKLLKKRLLGVL